MSKKSVVTLSIMLVLTLSACGMKSGLTMPPGPAPEPVLGNPKPAPAPANPNR